MGSWTDFASDELALTHCPTTTQNLPHDKNASPAWLVHCDRKLCCFGFGKARFCCWLMGVARQHAENSSNLPCGYPCGSMWWVQSALSTAPQQHAQKDKCRKLRRIWLGWNGDNWPTHVPREARVPGSALPAPWNWRENPHPQGR